MSPFWAVKESVEAWLKCMEPVCPKWLLAVFAVCAVIPLDPFDEIPPAIALLVIMILQPQRFRKFPAAWRDLGASLALVWYEGVEAA